MIFAFVTPIFFLSFGLLPIATAIIIEGGEPRSISFGSTLPSDRRNASCHSAMVTFDAHEQYPLLAPSGRQVPAELLPVHDYLRLLVPDEGPQLLSKLSLALEGFLNSDAPQWQKFRILVKHLYRVVDHIPPHVVNGIPRQIYGEHLMIQLQKLQKPDFNEFLSEVYRYQSLSSTSHRPQMNIGRITPIPVMEQLDQLEKDLILFSHVLKTLLDPRNDVGVVGEAALLISGIFKKSKYYPALRALPIGDFGAITPAKMQNLAQSPDVLSIFYQLSQQTTEQRPWVFRLWEEALRPALLNPKTHPLVSLFFFKEEPHYFCSVREYRGSIFKRLRQFGKRSHLPQYYYLGLDFSKSYFGEMKGPRFHSEDLPLDILVPEVGSYLQPKTPNPLIMETILQQGKHQHLYLSSVPGSWAQQFIFKYFEKDKKEDILVSNVFRRAILEFRLLPAAFRNGDFNFSISDFLTFVPQGSNLLRSLLGYLARGPIVQNSLSVVEELLPMWLQIHVMRQKILKEGKSSFNVATFVQYVRALNDQSELCHRLVFNIYQEVISPDNGVIHIADLSPASFRGLWQTKSKIVNAYDFSKTFEQLRQVDESYEKLLALRNWLREMKPIEILDDESNYWHFVELLTKQKHQVQILVNSLEQVQVIFAAIPTHYSGPNSVINFVKQAERIEKIKRQLIATFAVTSTL